MIATTEAVKGAEVGFSNSGYVHFTSSIEYFQLCEHDSETEEETAEFKICTRRGLLLHSLTRTSVV